MVSRNQNQPGPHRWQNRNGWCPHLCRLTLILLLLGFLLLPPDPGLAYWRTYTQADKLPSANIQALAYRDDPLDFPPCDPASSATCPSVPGLWVGTDNGVTYLNGRVAASFFTGRQVHDLLFEPNGRLWIATATGLLWFDDARTPTDPRDDTPPELTTLSGRVSGVGLNPHTADGRLSYEILL